MNKFVKYSTLASLIALNSIVEAKEPRHHKTSFSVTHGIGVNLENKSEVLFSAGLSATHIPLTPYKVDIFGLPNIDLQLMLETPINGSQEDVGVMFTKRLNMISHYLTPYKDNKKNEGQEYMELGPELKFLRPYDSSVQFYGGLSYGQGMETKNLKFKLNVGFQAGKDYLLIPNLSLMFRINKYFSLGGQVEGILPGAKGIFPGHLQLSPKFSLNLSKQHSITAKPYFMLNGLAAENKEKGRRFPPVQLGLNLVYSGISN